MYPLSRSRKYPREEIKVKSQRMERSTKKQPSGCGIDSSKTKTQHLCTSSKKKKDKMWKSEGGLVEKKEVNSRGKRVIGHGYDHSILCIGVVL